MSADSMSPKPGLSPRNALFLGALLGAALIAAVALLGGIGTSGAETNTILLVEGKDGCFVYNKNTGMKVKKDKSLKWKVTNLCTNEEVLSVGNFRREREEDLGGPERPTELRNCEAKEVAGWVPSGTYPFTREDLDDDRSVEIDPNGGTKSFKLKVLKDAQLPGERLYYLYDICLGVKGAHRKQSDPRIMIEN